jgi:predicted Holliday junction resolvase-like endonuclease
LQISKSSDFCDSGDILSQREPQEVREKMNNTDLVSFYKSQHTMYGECPLCQEPFRLSEIKIWCGKPPNDWLLKLRKREQEIEEESASIDEKVRGRIDTSVKTRIGQVMQNILPQFSAYRPDEMRWLGDPVDWVVFDGKQSGTIKEVVFMEGKSTDRTLLSPIQRELRRAVTEKRVAFRTISLSEKLSELVRMS